jgi:hypothetical protein
MKAVARLFALYFTGSTSARAWTLIGVAVIVAGCAFNVWYGQARFSFGFMDRYGSTPRWLFTLLEASPLAGSLALVFGSALLPKVVGQLALSRRLRLLPGGRAKVIASALATISALAVLVSFIVAVIALTLEPRSVLGGISEFVEILAIWFALAFTAYSLLHTGLWLVGRFGSALGVLTGVLLLVGILAFTMRVVALFGGARRAFFGASMAIVVMVLSAFFALAILWAPRLRGAAKS